MLLVNVLCGNNIKKRSKAIRRTGFYKKDSSFLDKYTRQVIVKKNKFNKIPKYNTQKVQEERERQKEMNNYLQFCESTSSFINDKQEEDIIFFINSVFNNSIFKNTREDETSKILIINYIKSAKDKRLHDYDDKIKFYEEFEEEYKKLGQENKELKRKYIELEQENKELKKYFTKLEETNKRLEIKYQVYKKKYMVLENDYEELERDYKKLSIKYKVYEKNNIKLESDYEKLEKDYKKLAIKYKILKRKYIELKKDDTN